MLRNYYPEMGKKPKAQIESRLSYDGRHFIIDTPYELKGRGITKMEVKWDKKSYKYWHDWKSYTITQNAFKILSEKYDIAHAVWFD